MSVTSIFANIIYTLGPPDALYPEGSAACSTQGGTLFLLQSHGSFLIASYVGSGEGSSRERVIEHDQGRKVAEPVSKHSSDASLFRGQIFI